MTKASLLPRVAATLAAVALPLAAPASALAKASNGGAHIGGGGSIVRTIVGLAIVIGVIYGVAWVLRQVKASRQPRATGTGLAALASVPLGSGRAVHLVRAGTDLVLLGVAEQGVVPIRTYTEEEARAAGLVDEDGMLILPEDETDRRERSDAPRRLPMPKLALPQLALGGPNARLRAARTAGRPALAQPRPKLALGRGPTPRDALDQLRAWTVRG
jgi:flagellar protein FliO/FliZ